MAGEGGGACIKNIHKYISMKEIISRDVEVDVSEYQQITNNGILTLSIRLIALYIKHKP